MTLRRGAQSVAVRPQSAQKGDIVRKPRAANPRVLRIGLAVAGCLAVATLSGAQPVRLVKDIQPVPNSTLAPYLRIGRFASLGDRLVFAGREGFDPSWLWTTDGTTEGTVPLGPHPGTYGAILGPIALGPIAIFGVEGHGIWKTDGTPEGTVLIKNVPLAPTEYVCGYPELAGSPCHSFVVVGSLAYFVTIDNKGSEVWRTDGTATGTRPLIAFPPLGVAHHLVAFRNRLYFGGTLTLKSFGIFSSDGTPEGTKFFKKGVTTGGLAVAGAKLFFTDADTNSVWVSDGSPRGTKRLTRFNPHDRSMYVVDLATAGTSAFFKVVKESGRELWTSDGTAAGTHVVIPEGETLLDTSSSAPLDGHLLFFSRGGEDNYLWKSDGTVAGTRIVKNLGPSDCVNNYSDSSCDISLETAAGRVFFALTNNLASDLWVSDGTDAGTHMVASFSIDSIPGGVTRLGSSVLFGAHVGPSVISPMAELWAMPAPIDVFVRDTRGELGTCGGTAEFPVLLSGPSEDVVTVEFATADGTGRAGVDYQPASGTLSFPPGSVASAVQVTLTCMPGVRAAPKTFFLDLTNATEARIARARGMAGPGTGPVRTTVSAR